MELLNKENQIKCEGCSIVSGGNRIFEITHAVMYQSVAAFEEYLSSESQKSEEWLYLNLVITYLHLDMFFRARIRDKRGSNYTKETFNNDCKDCLDNILKMIDMKNNEPD